MSRLGAWAVHLLTASGAALAFVAAVAAGHGAWQVVFLCLGLALIVDGIDGPLARRIHVKQRIPWFDGAALDFVVDYANYVKRMKTSEQSFRGFPAVWNVLIFVLMIYRLPQLVTLAVVLVAAILTFSPVEFIHPVRVKRMRPLTLTVTFVWAILAVVALADDLRPGAFVSVALAVTSIYLAGIGAFLQATREEFGA